MNTIERYWRERTARRYTQFTDLEELAESAVRELQSRIAAAEERARELETENGRLKVCGNCEHNGKSYILECHDDEDKPFVGGLCVCKFTPSRWTERRGEE